MKKRIVLALITCIVGIIYILDWIIFAEQNVDLHDDFPALKAKYVSRFPEFIKPLIESNPQPAAILFAILFALCGAVFIRENKVIFKVLAVTSFILAFWNLFSIM